MSKLNPLYMEGEGTGAGAGAATPPVKPEGSDPSTAALKQNVELLTRAVGLLGGSMEEIKGSNAKLTELVAGLVKPTAAAPPAITQESLLEGIDFENLDKSQIANLILQKATTLAEAKIKDATEGATGKLRTEIEALGAVVHGDISKRSIDAAAAERPDFFEWTAEIREAFKAHPTLTVIEAYNLVKSNPGYAKKVEEMGTKYKPKNTNIISLLPGAGGSRGDGGGKMNRGDAAADAWDKVMSNVSGFS